MATDAAMVGHRWAELWSADGDLGITDELVAPGFVSHGAPPGFRPVRRGSGSG